MNQIQLSCTVQRLPGGCDYSHVELLPAEMQALDGKTARVDGETIRFRMWQGKRLYVNCRNWTLGYFAVSEWSLDWGQVQVAMLEKANGNPPSPMVAKAVAQLLGIERSRLVAA
jgi:hypothetical protein